MSSDRRLTARRSPATEVLVVLPTFNERENLERVVSGVRHLGHDVLVVDDASPDGTGDIADGLAAADEGVRVMHRERKLGLGSAYEDAFRIGLAEGSRLLVEMDADGSHRAQDLQPIVDAARGCGGLAVGSRYVRGGQIVGWPRHRLLLSWGANVYCRTLLSLKVRDCTSGFRCYTRELLSSIDLDGIVSQGYSFQIEMVHRTVRLGYPVVEVPIRFEDRVAGASKVSQGEIRRALWTVLRLSMSR
ncbi:MAG: polyprenol monophosphomannose synthase [Chloroflexi bacterium]|nr:MAG: polyprenol monophosphomannose synthase [Chloroflexota bacterium]TMG21779.1 MAG: polyprenol monophosphomannose synthase [Chloroflexota bacterium]TMG65345.1 MAG: polyprenol monophosphomannose synthase [Chloroflexota bacterium]